LPSEKYFAVQGTDTIVVESAQTSRSSAYAPHTCGRIAKAHALSMCNLDRKASPETMFAAARVPKDHAERLVQREIKLLMNRIFQIIPTGGGYIAGFFSGP
jgi:hypothetical protein